ncbi:hypothetical protein SUGI_1130300 [Cryptomeria japonica]|uniref:uncharacterized protein LOC131032658 n=1 Tax=Cryptomeria japonica TaxID=3369 RepID=UPI002414B96F|nr:uncharacterized protein LOC131032658 [Cryptomeria japonica]GLJ53059.1 hypothetical protein SUGI_1130300 [Cryptomeria japonica]
MGLKLDFPLLLFTFLLLLLIFCDGGEGRYLLEDQSTASFPHDYQSPAPKRPGSVKQTPPRKILVGTLQGLHLFDHHGHHRHLFAASYDGCCQNYCCARKSFSLCCQTNG